MRNNQTRDKVLAISITVLALVIALGIGYAFFSASASNANHETVSTETATLSLKFADNDNGVSGVLNLGESIIKKFTLENTGTKDAYARINWVNLVNTYTKGSLEYDLQESDNENGAFVSLDLNLVPVSENEVTKTLKNSILIHPNEKKYYRLIITFKNLSINQNSDIDANFYSYFSLEEGSEPETAENAFKKLKELNTGLEIKNDTPNFSNIANSSSNSGIYKMEDDYGESLYFRGNIINNYVKFGKDKNNNDMYFRIIRINGDGSLRLLYDGTSAHANSEITEDRIVGSTNFNSNGYDIGYLGYMYGNIGGGSTSYEQAFMNINNSVIKTYLENWYTENIKDTEYSKYISDEIFCNDRSKPSQDLGYGSSVTSRFNGLIRNVNSKQPSLKCNRLVDAFTVNDEEKGNGKSLYPVGLITVDELTLGGNIDYNPNDKTFLYKGVDYWTMSPSRSYKRVNSYTNFEIFVLTKNYGISTIYKEESAGVAPVINLSYNTVKKLIGKGTSDNPFKIEI